jgi:hypothetical protein
MRVYIKSAMGPFPQHPETGVAQRLQPSRRGSDGTRDRLAPPMLCNHADVEINARAPPQRLVLPLLCR